MKVETKYLRPKKAALLKERYGMYENGAEARISEIQDGLVLPVYTDIHGDLITGVIDNTGNFVNDSHTVDFPEEIEDYARSIDSYGREDETIVFLGLFNSHWGHFITDCLSTFWFIGSVEADKFVYTYPEGEIPKIEGNIKIALELLGVMDKIEFVSKPTRYRKVYVPRKGMVPREYALKESSTVYETIISNALKDLRSDDTDHNAFPEKILLSRALFQKAKANDIGMEVVERFFISNGFAPLYPEKLSLKELIVYLSKAKEVAAISGTLTHNMLFAPSGSCLTVIEKYANINNYQQGIDIIKNLDSTYIDASYFFCTVDPGLGPFVLAETPELHRFMEDRGFRYSQSHLNCGKILRRFFRLYYRHYKRTWIMPEWLEPEIELFGEAYRASLPVFGPWLDGARPIFLSDLLRPRYLAKKLISLLKH